MKKVSITKHWVKAAYFKLKHLWYTSTSTNFFKVELKYEDFLFLLQNNDGSHTSYG